MIWLKVAVKRLLYEFYLRILPHGSRVRDFLSIAILSSVAVKSLTQEQPPDLLCVAVIFLCFP